MTGLRPPIDIPDLLGEGPAVDRFHRAAHAPRRRDPARPAAALHAALLAGGLNLGPARMAECCSLTYLQLVWATEWYLGDEQLQTAMTSSLTYLLVDRRQLTGLDRGSGMQALQADLLADAVPGELPGRNAFGQDQRELTAEHDESSRWRAVLRHCSSTRRRARPSVKRSSCRTGGPPSAPPTRMSSLRGVAARLGAVRQLDAMHLQRNALFAVAAGRRQWPLTSKPEPHHTNSGTPGCRTRSSPATSPSPAARPARSRSSTSPTSGLDGRSTRHRIPTAFSSASITCSSGIASVITPTDSTNVTIMLRQRRQRRSRSSCRRASRANCGPVRRRARECRRHALRRVRCCSGFG